MSQWRPSESGILRKTNVEDNLNELLVFGYSCKIFRDDEKALNIDQGRHLIPWMGNDSIKIDRYDGRAALPDLKYYEASKEGYDTLRWLGLSESEKRLEELCDSERYYSLEINEEEEELYKEEDAKRNKTKEFAFQYDTTTNSDVIEEKEGIPTVSEKDEDDEPYTPLPVLDVPIDIGMPKTLKEYARIEKTASFVCRQGLQMEILIKAKQADNAQFSFLLSQDPLHKFYRHVLSALKNGHYEPQCEKKSEPPPEPTQDEKESDYLHPSLQSTISKQSKPPLFPYVPTPTLAYRPSADCAYSQLVNRIQGVGTNGTCDDAAKKLTTETRDVVEQSLMSKLTLEQQYQQYYYVQYFYEHWRHHAINSDQGAMYAGLPMEYSQLDINMQTYINQLAWTHFVQQTQSNTPSSSDGSSYAKIVSHMNKEVTNQYSTNVPQLQLTSCFPEKNEELDKTEVNKPLLSLAAYGSGSDSDCELSEPTVTSSTKKKDAQESDLSIEDQSVIDKMAEYVCKNGDQFEEIIKKKGDARFRFLNSDNMFHKYYKSKLEHLKRTTVQPKNIVRKESQASIRIEGQKAGVCKATETSITPISFSIKKPKEEQPDIKSFLAMEDSSESETSMQPCCSSPSTVPTMTTGHTEMSLINKTVNEQMELLEGIVTSKRESPISSDHRHRTSKACRKSRSSSSHRKVRTPRSSSRSSSSSIGKKRDPRSRSHSRSSHLKSTNSSNRINNSPSTDNLDKENEKNIQNDSINNRLPTDDLILEMVDGEEGKTDGDIVQQKARQLERKRKAAMFLKLKSISSEKLDNLGSNKNEPDSPREKIEERFRYKRRSRKRSSSEKKYVSLYTSSSGSRGSRLSPSKESRKAKKRHTKSKERSASGKSDYDENRRKDKKKKYQKLKQKKSKKKQKKQRSRSITRSRSRSKSNDSSIKSHISITDSS